MKRRESLIGQVVAINVLLVVAVLFAASAAAGLDLAVREERRRLARDLHDEVNQALTAILLRLEALSHDAEEPLARELGQLKALVNQAMEELLRLARTLRPAALDDLGLIAAIEGQLARFSEQTGIQAVLSAEGAPEAITEDQQTVI